MRVIFLDVDGVLNCEGTFKDIYYEWKKTGVRRTELDEKKVALLKDIIDLTGSEIVLSSTWRLGFDDKLNPTRTETKDLVKMFNEYGITILDRTKHLGTRRGVEIREWLSRHEDVEDFVILDDDTDMEEYTNTNLVKTSFYGEGLTEEHFDIIKEKFNIKDKMKDKE